jgi:putative MATE family efflux protein
MPDWTQGSIPLNLLKLSWPMMLGGTLNMLGPTIDVVWVGKLGSAAVAGVGVAGIVSQLLMSAMMGMVAGMRAMVARRIGEGDEQGARSVATQTIVASSVVALVMSVIGIVVAAPILRMLGLAEDVVQDGALYLRLIFISSVPMWLRFVLEGCMQSTGDSIRPLIVTAIYRSIHLAVCPFLALGLWIFPKMGIAGVGLMNIISQSIGLTISAWIMLSGRTRIRVSFRGFKLHMATLWAVARIGFPSSIMGVQMSLAAFVLIRFLSPFGTTAVAAHTVWQRVDFMLMMPLMGLGMGAGILTGQNLGAGRPDRAVKSGWTAVVIAEAVTITGAIILVFASESIVRLFNSDPEVVDMGGIFLRIASITYLVLGFAGVLQNCVSGAGDTLPPLILSAVGTWAVMLPLTYLLSQRTSLGIYGIRWAQVITSYASTVAFLLYFISGRWKRIKV